MTVLLRQRGMCILRLLMLILCSSLAACDPPDGKSKVSTAKEPVDPLWNVSSELALMEAGVKMQRQVACIMSEAFAKQPDEKRAKPRGEFMQALADRMKSEAMAKCAALRIAEEKGAGVFRAIRDAGRAPVDAYFFAFVEDHEGDGNEYVSVGLFSSPADCALSENTLRENDFATTRCRKWQPPFFSRSVGKKE